MTLRQRHRINTLLSNTTSMRTRAARVAMAVRQNNLQLSPAQDQEWLSPAGNLCVWPPSRTNLSPTSHLNFIPCYVCYIVHWIGIFWSVIGHTLSGQTWGRGEALMTSPVHARCPHPSQGTHSRAGSVRLAPCGYPGRPESQCSSDTPLRHVDVAQESQFPGFSASAMRAFEREGCKRMTSNLDEGGGSRRGCPRLRTL